MIYSGESEGDGLGTAIFWYEELLCVWVSFGNYLVSINLENGTSKVGKVDGESFALRENFPYFVVTDSLWVVGGIEDSAAGIDLKCFEVGLKGLEMRQTGCGFGCVYTAFVQVGDCMFVFGGYCDDGYSNELAQVKVGNGLEIEVLTRNFKYPKPRYEHSLQAYGKYLWVFGGCSEDEV